MAQENVSAANARPVKVDAPAFNINCGSAVSDKRPETMTTPAPERGV